MTGAQATCRVQRHGPSFQMLMSLRAGRNTDRGSHACRTPSRRLPLSIQITQANHWPRSQRQSRINPGAGGG